MKKPENFEGVRELWTQFAGRGIVNDVQFDGKYAVFFGGNCVFEKFNRFSEMEEPHCGQFLHPKNGFFCNSADFMVKNDSKVLAT